MGQKIIIISILCCTLFFGSCIRRSTEQQDAVSVEQKDSVSTPDSIVQVVAQGTNAIAANRTSAQERYSNIESGIAIAALSVSILSILLSSLLIISFRRKDIYIKEELHHMSHEQGRCFDNISSLKNQFNNHTHTAFDDYSRRLDNLETKIVELLSLEPKPITSPPVSQPKSTSKKHGYKPQGRMIVREGYLGINKEKFFNDFYESLDDKAYFRVSIFDNNEGEFELVDLQRIKSADSIGLAVETDGCRIEEARTYETKQKGKIKKGDGDLWIIDSPLKLTLNK